MVARRSIHASMGLRLRQQGKLLMKKVVVGSGWWCAEEAHEWTIGSPRTRTRRFFETWHNQILDCIAPDIIHVTDSAAPLKPANYARLPGVVWTSLDRNYGHANDIRTGKIETKYSGFTRSVLLGAAFALMCDATHYVYVEQDCLVFGRDFLEAAMGSSNADIFLGMPTENGLGLSGIAAPMLQQSVIIVRKTGLERFISQLLSSPHTDGEISPEEAMRLLLPPFDLLNIPYGRSRPIDPSAPNFYAQHLSEAELELIRPRLATRQVRRPKWMFPFTRLTSDKAT
jgi:hypothetical protein